MSTEEKIELTTEEDLNKIVEENFRISDKSENEDEEEQKKDGRDSEYNSAESDNEDNVDGKETLSDDLIDEEKLKEEEEDLREEQLNDRHEEAKVYKDAGNTEYKNEEYKASILSYTQGLLVCPLKEKELRAVLFSNRAASKVKLNLKELAIEDCSASLTHNPSYMKPLIRRAKLYEETEKLDEALVDYQKILEVDPSCREAYIAVQKLPHQINERNEKLKTEMMGKLKELGNMVLRPFGLSTNNFQLQQDPNSGGYSINFTK